METNAWEAMVDALHEYEDTHLAEKIYHSRIPEIMERMREREAEIHGIREAEYFTSLTERLRKLKENSGTQETRDFLKKTYE